MSGKSCCRIGDEMAHRQLITIPLALALLVGSAAPVRGLAQGVPPVPSPVCAYCGTPLPYGVHAASCPYAAKGTSKPAAAKPPSHPPGPSTQALVTGMIFESLLSSLFSDGSGNVEAVAAAQQQAAALAAQQAAAAQAARAAAAQAAFDQMMKSYKLLDDSPGLVYKSIAGGDLGFKQLDGETETLAAGARHPFDTAGDAELPGPQETGPATPFFGDSMPAENLRLLVEPENDPRVVNLRAAVGFVAQSLKTEADAPDPGTPAPPGKPKNRPAPTSADCVRMAASLQGFVTQRSQFQKTILLAQSQVETWQEANRNALLNGVKDGLEYFAGQYLEVLGNRGKAAERLGAIFERNAARMAQEGVDTARIARKIERLKVLSASGQAAEFASNLNDWQTFVKDGLSSLMARLAASDGEFRALMEDPELAKYLTTEAPGLNALLDLSKLAASSQVFGKWVARKLPLVAGLEISIKQLYNATDWYLSFQHIRESNEINGRVLAAARSLQQSIDDTRLAYSACAQGGAGQ